MRQRKRLLLLIPLPAVVLIAAVILALPGFVSSAAHRATIERLASSLTGRDVRIGGKLSLALLPAPQLIAERITISSLAAGPAAETITARSLTLNIALGALLKGRLQASSMTLISPTITIPWPLPPGEQPEWLAALHAQIDNGRVILGALTFTRVNADIFTGGGGAVSGSGSFLTDGHPLTLSVSLGAKDASGNAAVTVDAQSNDGAAAVHLAGTLNAAGELNGTAGFGALTRGSSQRVTGTANVQITGSGVRADSIRLAQGRTDLAGAAELIFGPEQLDATLSGQYLNLARLRPLAGIGAILPARLDLTASDASLAGVTFPLLHLHAEATTGGVAVQRLDASLPGAASLTGEGRIDQAGNITGQIRLDTGDLPGLLVAYGGPAVVPAGWQAAHLAAMIMGNPAHLMVDQIGGSVGPSHLHGALVFSTITGRILTAGELNFDRLDLTALAWPKAMPPLNPAILLDGEITVDHATIGRLTLSHLLIDGEWDRQLTIRRVSAALDGGIAAASLNFSAADMLSARALLTLPMAAPLVALLPAAFRPPAPLAQAPLTLSLLARGPAAALSSSAAATLGSFTITTSPMINLANLTAAGPLTLRDPDAIAALSVFGLKTGLAWPGAGSIGLTADFAAAPGQFALPDFVLSLGDLTADGTFAVSADQIKADIDADTLALPPPGGKVAIPWTALAGTSGSLKLSAQRVLLGGAALLGPISAALTLAPDLLTLAVPNASLAGGNLSGSVTAATNAANSESAPAPPRFAAKFVLAGADASRIHLPVAFPITIPSGALDATASLTAAGYTPAAWAATLAGPVTLSASNGSLDGFDLTGMAAALTLAHRAAALRAALTKGATATATLTLAGTFAQGSLGLTHAALTGPDGAASATGSIDLADQTIALNFSFAPEVAPPLTINLATIGTWKSPKQIPALSDALNWRPAK